MLQLLLSVINSNLNKIVQQESYIEMTRSGIINENYKEEVIADPVDNQKSEEKTAMKNLGEVLRMARAAKQEALRKAEEEAKKKEAMQTQPMTSM